MWPDPVLGTLSFFSEQFPTPFHAAFLHDIVEHVCRSNLET